MLVRGAVGRGTDEILGRRGAIDDETSVWVCGIVVAPGVGGASDRGR